MERSPSEYAKTRGVYFDTYKRCWRVEKAINGKRYRRSFNSHEEAIICLFNIMTEKLNDKTSTLRFDYDARRWILNFEKDGKLNEVTFKETDDVYGYWMATKQKGKVKMPEPPESESENLEETIRKNLKKYIHGGFFSVKEFVEDVESTTFQNVKARAECQKESILNGVILSMCYTVGDGTYKSWHHIEKFLFANGVLGRAVKHMFYVNMEWRGFANYSPWVSEARIDEKFAEYKISGVFDYKEYVLDAMKNVLKHPEWKNIYMKGSISFAAKFCLARLITKDKMVEPNMLEEKLDELGVTGDMMLLTTSILKKWRAKIEQ